MKIMVRYLTLISRSINRFTESTGNLISWLTLLMMVAICGVVFLRYVLGAGSIALQESVSYLHGTLFMLAMAFTLKHGGHVRVDIFYRKASPKTRAVVDLLGGLLFLIPISILILVTCWDYVAASWAIRETSQDANGLPWVYLLKTLILIMPATLLLQGISEVISNGLFLAGQTAAPESEAMEGIL